MSGPDDTSRERPDRPNDRIPNGSPPAAEPSGEAGHAIPFGEGVYGLGRDSSGRTSRSTPYSDGSGTFGSEEPPGAPESEVPPEFDFRRLAAELGFEGHTEGRQCVGFCPICRSAELLRAFATPELRSAWNEFQHELTRALRAAAARYAESGESEQADPGERITEIPIE
jgi:hypothetical protein